MPAVTAFNISPIAVLIRHASGF